jgi:hypothetical protein
MDNTSIRQCMNLRYRDRMGWKLIGHGKGTRVGCAVQDLIYDFF